LNGKTPIPDVDSQECPHILIADDEVNIIYAVEWVLEDIPCTVSRAMNTKDAIHKATEQRPDLVILDMRMPKDREAAGLLDEFAGIKVCRALRNNMSTKKTPIIMLTVMSESEGKDESIDAGADEYLTKPFNSDHLLQTVNGFLNSQ
jgi:CheY-like chemotaxis protein